MKAGSHELTPINPTLKQNAVTLIRRSFERWDFIGSNHTPPREWSHPVKFGDLLDSQLTVTPFHRSYPKPAFGLISKQVDAKLTAIYE